METHVAGEGRPEASASAATPPGHQDSLAATKDLVAFALDVLPSMRLPSGLYCFDLRPGEPQGRGASVRYSLMVLLGMQRARRGGHPVNDDLDALFERCMAHRHTFTPGDLGLALWASSRTDGGAIPGLVDQLHRAMQCEIDLERLVGMEVAWIMIGLAHAVEHSPQAQGLLERVGTHLRGARRATSGLYYHDARSRARRRLPNFATEIYTVLALSVCAGRLGDDAARADAECLAGHLLRLQLADGGWPWLFHADRATVVERYEIYSVHQDAMAPMALLELTELTGDGRYEAAAVRGLGWSTGRNELGVNLLDREQGFAHRSIRRRSPWHRVALAANVGAAMTTGRAVRPAGSAVELNAVSRPYHLGWILEAWGDRPKHGAGGGVAR